MKLLVTILLLVSCIASRAQNNYCGCPKSSDVVAEKPYKIFRFSNGKTIAITSAPDTSSGVYTEFAIYECGKNDIVEFYDGTQPCFIDFASDTLFVQLLEPLATGPNLELVDTTWLIEKYTYDKGKLAKYWQLTPSCFYSDQQILTVLTEYRNTQVEGNADGEKMMALANKLMLAAISGSKQAKQYFNDFREKYKPDGAHSEWYSDMAAIIEIAAQLDGTKTKRIDK